MNGDGKADIIGFGLQNVAVSLSTGSSSDYALNWIYGDYCFNQGWDNNTFRTVADVNNDGKADVIGCGYSQLNVSLAY